ncbi:VOC family protein [Actinoplanes teichomyceticus]|uniref:VOC domain-containing protein n=1 Tax=Actinoplanes teichomyceticus TaxID=1867 RepID=A0A561VS77_ACTTI|nr:VOC family protein [Actinoplanes teichomyceticus]TWG14474.1 hypothetical protein FHX34_104774 [Actinoplanes teichomyceticus]GIF16276.1 dioxygenase [Actinoplanes teichomyceticus]
MILKTYARVFVASLDQSLPLLEKLVGRPADLRFPFDQVEIAAVGDFLVIAGDQQALDPLREAVGPVIVDDLEKTIRELIDAGATIDQPVSPSVTGSFAYLRHPDGSLVEYVQWRPELVTRIIT